ncbi:aspartate aminotransferase family protein [Alicyclobacillus acidocaldarius]|uniref:Aminotransferase class-III n=1 Tax=Alicyclobacillus acidocaldarius subsp. acidocaldarius (strain ATCC 27009 / DSM 446 / BCRC 14685 / JCM 5260 / KCTC 1825 / NBRC 15652 / NCIMB 11725 / NRRL B-14509 / 104-IA) TaxID=521098 RepID=C8WTT0_ALIAD|nr:aspartate aminotransferase family protein [Alicyclobacillus acidocaldarius]ACV59672.1 aminotransferase class-III [Alicyclobacillus acidocaldarius subsp. acidocaldarius DSM 446]
MSVEEEVLGAGAPAWLEKDRRYVWHGMVTYAAAQNPMAIVEGDGAWVVDAEGRRYLDAMSGLWCVNLGYSQPRLAEAAHRQLTTMPYYPLTNTHLPAIQLAEKLSDWLGAEYRVFFSNSGSEANEVAFKIARQYHAQRGEPNRWKILSRYRAYHGNTMGALAASGQFERKYRYEPLAPGFVHVPPPDCYRCPFGRTPSTCALECAAHIDDVMRWEFDDTIAAVILEPVITGGGVLVPPDGYLQKVKEICHRHGALMIVDEVICGFGRTGARFGHQRFGVQPDIVTMAKGITSGYLPLAATAVRADLFDEAFARDEDYAHLRHVNTFGGHPAACAVALATLDIMEAEGFVDRARHLGEVLAAELQRLRGIQVVGDIRTFGLLAGIELVEDRETKAPASASLTAQVVSECRKRGVIVGKTGDTTPGGNNVITLCPPFVVSEEELRHIVHVLEEALQAVV